MSFEINPNAPNPIYRQIVEQVRRQIASGQLPAGHALPSVRAVALEHAINPMTVSKAYSMLEAEGLLERLRGVGMVIAKLKNRNTQRGNLELLTPALETAAQIARQLGLSSEQALAAFESCLEENNPKEFHDKQ
jgi:GntR family transcriptional regulator